MSAVGRATPLESGAGTRRERGFVYGSLAALGALVFALDTSWTALAVSLPLALLVADFLSGLVHWAFDHHVPPDHPLLGRFVADFLDHHRHPRRTLEVAFVRSAWQSCAFVALPLGLLAASLPGRSHLVAFLYSIALLAVFAPQLHKLAHHPRPPRWIRALQRSRVILSPRAHARHHKRPHDRAFCIVTGWCNAPLDALGFWNALDFLLGPRGADASSRSSSGDPRTQP